VTKVISLYTGAGGLDYGFEKAGFDTAVAVEFDHDCCRTLRANRPSWAVIENDILQVSTSEILRAGGLAVGEADLLLGGPPCQPFSKSGYWATGDSKRLKDPRASTLDAYLRVLEEAQPRAFVLENVEGLAYQRKNEGLMLLLDAIDQINRRTGHNYKTHMQVLNAASFGVPQLRNRVFIVAARDGAAFQFPKPRFSDEAESGLPAYSTAWDALHDVGPLEDENLDVRGKWAELLPSIPEGKNYLYHTDRDKGLPLFGWRTRYWSFLLKLAKSLPSWTIQAQPGPAIGPFHWENRRLGMRELCRLQTFPDDVCVTGSLSAQQRQIGNAVPSLLAEVLGREVRKLLGYEELQGEPTLLPNRQSAVPPPSRPSLVPLRYRELAGVHNAHPGTGLGPAAMARGDARKLA
jgi:DNA (cytosine-5)-methyltransferase 1